MSKHRRKLPAPGDNEEAAKTTWVYWISRDSLDEALSELCSLWNEKPLRTKVGSRVLWSHATGHIGSYRPDEVSRWFRTYPATDRELICVETRPSKAEYDAAKRGAQP